MLMEMFMCLFSHVKMAYWKEPIYCYFQVYISQDDPGNLQIIFPMFTVPTK